MLKKILNIFKLPFLIALISFSWLKRFFISLIRMLLSCIFSLKRFLISLIIFYIQDLNFPLLYAVKTKIKKIKKQNVYYTP